MRNSTNTSAAKTQEQKFQEWDAAGSDALEPMDPNAPAPKGPEQLAVEHRDLAGYRQALSGIKAQGLD